MLTREETYATFREMEYSHVWKPGERYLFSYTLHIGAYPNDFDRRYPVAITKNKFYDPDTVYFSFHDFFDAHDSERRADFRFIEGDFLFEIRVEDERLIPIGKALKDKALRQFQEPGAVKPLTLFFASATETLEMYGHELKPVALA